MATFYLRIEGVNLSNVLNDTRNINVIRGGSLSLRNAVKLLEEDKRFNNLQTISTGASVGLFSFVAASDEEAIKQKIVVENMLKGREYPYWVQHFTFVVDIHKATDDFLQDREAVIARNRFRQMQQLSLVMPNKNHASDVSPCKLDNLRPTGKKFVKLYENDEREDTLVSVSVRERLNYGRQEKQNFYIKEIENTAVNDDLKKLYFVQDIETLGKRNNPKLNNKIAVLYFDGNGFGAIQNEHCRTAIKQQDFDNAIQRQRKTFLADLLVKIQNDPDFKTADGRARIETLLWGGDEMAFVVPAWKGLEALNFFYEASKTWSFEGKTLTHAGGLVFCQANSPIQRIEKLARDLADGVKKTANGREDNFFDFMVLESIDFPTEPLALTRKKLFGEELRNSHMPLKPLLSWTKQHLNEANELKRLVSKGQAYQLVRAAVKGMNEFNEQYKRLTQLIKKSDDSFWHGMLELGQADDESLTKVENILKTLFPNDENDRWRWLHLVELWDYLV